MTDLQPPRVTTGATRGPRSSAPASPRSPSASPLVCRLCGSDQVARRYHVHGFDVYACGGCTVSFRDPLPEEGELVAMYEDARYHASAYFQNAGRDYRRLAPEVRIYRRALTDLADLMAGTPSARSDLAHVRPAVRPRLLDVGCGAGVFLDLAREHGWEVQGVELSEQHAAHARLTFGVEVWQGDFLSAPLAPDSFDAITMWDFLEHVVDPHAVLARAHQLLVPGGVLLVFTIESGSLFNTTGDMLYRLAGARARRPLELLYDWRHNYYFTQSSLARLIESQGFRIERWRSDRAYLGRWLAEPAPWYLVAGGVVLDALSLAVRRPYRRTAFCRRARV